MGQIFAFKCVEMLNMLPEMYGNVLHCAGGSLQAIWV